MAKNLNLNTYNSIGTTGCLVKVENKGAVLSEFILSDKIKIGEQISSMKTNDGNIETTVIEIHSPVDKINNGKNAKNFIVTTKNKRIYSVTFLH